MLMTTFRAVAGSVLVVAALAGCGESAAERQPPDVATLQTVGARSAAPSAPSATERPVVRPDGGKAEFDSYVAVWEKCLFGEGVPRSTGGKPPRGPGYEAAFATCAHLYPEDWMEREARTNPEYVDRLRETAKCLTAKGHQVTVGGDPVSLLYGANTSANKAYDDEQVCQRAAFREDIRKYEGG